MHRRIHKHAQFRLNFKNEKDKARQLETYKRFLKLENEMMFRRHRAGESGLRIARLRAEVIDVLLQRLFENALNTIESENGEGAPPFCLIAQGGYGRGELSPLSDIDVMFLFPDDVRGPAVKAFQQRLNDHLLYTLWDLGFKIGHATRRLSEVFEDARKDMHVKTALLESRLVAGPETLFDVFRRAYTEFCRNENPKEYLQDRLRDQAQRRKRYGETVFLQEPDIKNGVGGLRDYQNALWMARIKLGITRVEELCAHDYLSENEQRDFSTAYDFLLRVRNDLHFSLKRPTDLLDLEKQPLVAHHLGYHQEDIFERVEHFMRDYYRHAQTIHRISKLLEKRLALRPANGATKGSFRKMVAERRRQRQRQIDGLIQRGSELSFESPGIFEQDPERLIRVFRHCQKWQCTMDFELESLVQQSLPLISNRIINSPRANAAFRSILQEPGMVYPILNTMHELGVLGRFLPEFGRLTCLVQHEYYHRYTADIHTLNTLKELDAIFAVAEPGMEKYRDALHKTGAPALLYLILLLHDIGKSKGIAGHDKAGVEIGKQILARMQVDRKFWDLVLFIIGHHLMMARIWQKHDLDDPHTILSFAEQIEDPEKLAFLYVHTFCDARGTANGLWNSYKDTLHTQLYRATFERLTAGERLTMKNKEKMETTLREVRDRDIPEVSHEEIEAHFGLLPERYFVHTDPDEIVLHIRMVNQLLTRIAEAESVGALVPVIDWSDDIDRSLTVVNIVTWDRAGLFSKLAGAFGMAGLNILSAKATSRSDHIAIDTFYVAEPERGVVQSREARERFENAIKEALVSNKDLLPEILVHAKEQDEREWKESGERLAAPIPPKVEVYYDEALARGIAEIQATDQIGLLYQLTRTIYHHGGSITFAKIATERDVAIDTFYFEDANPEAREQPPSADHLEGLKEALKAVVTGPEDHRSSASHAG